MKHLPLLSSLCLVGILACTDVVTEPEPAPDIAKSTKVMAGGGRTYTESITGSGHFITGPLAYTPGVWRTFTMTAKKAQDGSVNGKFQVNLHLEDGPADVVRGTLSCFTILGNTAWVGGHKPGNDPTDVAFQVVDNGEGSGDPPDQVGLYLEAQFFGFPAGFAQDFCDDTPEFLDFGPPYGVAPIAVLLSPVEGGNIQIKAK